MGRQRHGCRALEQKKRGRLDLCNCRVGQNLHRDMAGMAVAVNTPSSTAGAGTRIRGRTAVAYVRPYEIRDKEHISPRKTHFTTKEHSRLTNLASKPWPGKRLVRAHPAGQRALRDRHCAHAARAKNKNEQCNHQALDDEQRALRRAQAGIAAPCARVLPIAEPHRRGDCERVRSFSLIHVREPGEKLV